MRVGTIAVLLSIIATATYAQTLASPQYGNENTQARTDAGHTAEVALTAAAIAAILIQASRDQYHATGRPCACPDDLMRNGRACGGKSAYSRPGVLSRFAIQPT